MKELSEKLVRLQVKTNRQEYKDYGKYITKACIKA